MWIASLPLWALTAILAGGSVSLFADCCKSGKADDAGACIFGLLLTSGAATLAVLVGRL